MIRFLLAAALALACLAGGPGRATIAHARQEVSRKPAASKLPDAELEKAIRAKFGKSKIAANGFQVRVQGGVATIEGKTDVVQHKGVATRLARSAGAVTVVNKIQVSDAARQRASQNLAKGRRRAQVKRSEVAGR